MTSPRSFALTMAIIGVLAPVDPSYRSPQRKVGSTNPNRGKQKAQRRARKKNR